MKRRVRPSPPRVTALSAAELAALLAHLEARGGLAGCDDTLKLTRGWLPGRVANPDAAVRWLQSRGGSCDCEVLLNVPDHERAEGSDDEGEGDDGGTDLVLRPSGRSPVVWN